MGKIAFLFAGQGAQAPGMGEAFYNASPAAKHIFDAVEAQRPGTIEQCFHGDAQTLMRTDNTQPCLFATDLACAAAAVEAGIRADCCAGFSLGELCALYFSGLFPVLEEVTRLVIVRGEAMQRCNEAHPGAMAAVLKLAPAQVEAICADIEDAWPVNYNCPGQTVVACAADKLADVTAAVKAAGGRCMPLKVGGSFHTPRMAPAYRALAEILPAVNNGSPTMPVYSNYSGGPYRLNECKHWLCEQVSHPVRWQQILEGMWADGVDTFIEFGPGTTLAGLVKRTLPGARTASVCDPESLQKCLEMMEQEGAQ